MKKKLLILPLIAAMFMTGCKEEQNENNESTENNTNENNNNENTNNGENENNNNGNGNGEGENGNGEGEDIDIPPLVFTSSFEDALKKNYKNMTVQFALSSTEVGEEYGYEYYADNNDFVAVLDGNTAETYGSSYAWSFYSFYEGKSYSYWKGASYVTEGWVSNGSKGHPVGIDLAYFYMPYFLSNITKDDVDDVMGTYVVKAESMDKVMEGLKFTYLTNDISYVDIKVNNDGYIEQIRGFDDPNDDSYGFMVKLGNFGKTKTDNLGVTLPPEIGPTTVKTYVEMIGHEEIPDIYMTDMSIVINDVVVSDDTYDVIMYPDDVVDISFTYKPNNANKREVNWISTNENAAVLLYGQESGHQYIRAVKPGETDIYVSHINEYNETISSKRIKVKVQEPKQVQESAEDVYRLTFTGTSGSDGNYTIGAANNVPGSNAPLTITSWRMVTREGTYSDNFDENDVVLYTEPTSQTNYNDRFEDEVIFDFGNQQVNKMSFAYGLYFNNSLNYLSYLENVTISTSNDGDSWIDIDVTDEMKAEFSKGSLSLGLSTKVMTKEFLPASMVKIVTKASSVGHTFGFCMKDFIFSADENCRNYDDVDAVPVTSIAITAPKNKIKLGSSMKFTSVIAPENASNKVVRWVSSNTEVLSIDSRTGLATALQAGTAKVTAVSTSVNGVTSNEFEVTVYEQEEVYDPDNFLVGKTFTAEKVMRLGNEFDVNFNIKNATSAVLTISTDFGLGKPLDNDFDASYEEFDPINKIYFYSTEDGATIKFRVADDGSYIELTYFKGDTYTLGDAEQGIILRKAA